MRLGIRVGSSSTKKQKQTFIVVNGGLQWRKFRSCRIPTVMVLVVDRSIAWVCHSAQRGALTNCTLFLIYARGHREKNSQWIWDMVRTAWIIHSEWEAALRRHNSLTFPWTGYSSYVHLVFGIRPRPDHKIIADNCITLYLHSNSVCCWSRMIIGPSGTVWSHEGAAGKARQAFSCICAKYTGQSHCILSQLEVSCVCFVSIWRQSYLCLQRY